jgi:hypothetical protein
MCAQMSQLQLCLLLMLSFPLVVNSWHLRLFARLKSSE